MRVLHCQSTSLFAELSSGRVSISRRAGVSEEGSSAAGPRVPPAQDQGSLAPGTSGDSSSHAWLAPGASSLRGQGTEHPRASRIPPVSLHGAEGSLFPTSFPFLPEGSLFPFSYFPFQCRLFPRGILRKAVPRVHCSSPRFPLPRQPHGGGAREGPCNGAPRSPQLTGYPQTCFSSPQPSLQTDPWAPQYPCPLKMRAQGKGAPLKISAVAQTSLLYKLRATPKVADFQGRINY